MQQLAQALIKVESQLHKLETRDISRTTRLHWEFHLPLIIMCLIWDIIIVRLEILIHHLRQQGLLCIYLLIVCVDGTAE